MELAFVAEGLAAVAGDVALQRLDGGLDGFVVEGDLPDSFGQACLVEGVQLCLLDADAGPQKDDNADILDRFVDRDDSVAAEIDGGADVRLKREIREAEAAGQDADDGLQLAIEGDGIANDSGVRLEVGAPEMVAENDDGRPVRAVFVVRKEAA